MAGDPKDERDSLFNYKLDPETESDELDQHRARFAGLTLEQYRVMRAYAAFKQHQLKLRQEKGSGSVDEE